MNDKEMKKDENGQQKKETARKKDKIKGKNNL
jgi:hypothetical protein